MWRGKEDIRRILVHIFSDGYVQMCREKVRDKQ